MIAELVGTVYILHINSRAAQEEPHNDSEDHSDDSFNIHPSGLFHSSRPSSHPMTPPSPNTAPLPVMAASGNSIGGSLPSLSLTNVSPVTPTGSYPRDGCNLMISFLPPLVDEASLLRRFAAYGAILKVKVIRNRTSGVSSYGFVVFQRKEHAEAAMAHEDGKPWMKKRIRVSYAKSEERRGFEIIVSHLPLAFTEEQIRFIFSQFGTILGIRFVEISASPFQECYLKYLTIEQCQTAIMLLNGRVVDGAPHPIIIQFMDPEMLIAPKFAPEKKMTEPEHISEVSQRSPRAIEIGSEMMRSSPTIVFPRPDINTPFGYSLLVSGLPPTVTTLQLLSLFAPYGQIIEIAIQTTPSFDGSQLLCRGTAILRLYGTSHYLQSALGSLHGAFVFPYHTPIMVSLCYENAMT